MSYDSDEPEPSERTYQESEEPSVRNDQEVMQQLPEAEASDVNHHGNPEDFAASPTSVLEDMLPLSHTHSEDLDHTSDGLLPNVDAPAESSSNQSNVSFQSVKKKNTHSIFIHTHVLCLTQDFYSPSQEQSDPTGETTVETVCLNATETVQEKQEVCSYPCPCIYLTKKYMIICYYITLNMNCQGSEEPLINDESKSAEDRRSLSTDASAEELNSHNN